MNPPHLTVWWFEDSEISYAMRSALYELRAIGGSCSSSKMVSGKAVYLANGSEVPISKRMINKMISKGLVEETYQNGCMLIRLTAVGWHWKPRVFSPMRMRERERILGLREIFA